ncbi:type 4b pilus protein PilO2 [Roseibium sp. RKSG952]|uniref:type 4b pilus protein PilO2 n=1 Tax=Roseibium sp. RKSG952 TaxID=2529384 RepID=UPI0012BC5E48|nr:type 4b pilus protein PilO2 [Roseibium sp. RKSG952]MTH97582.1 hypothetical protein [Roseibium sp. RKSG952]
MSNVEENFGGSDLELEEDYREDVGSGVGKIRVGKRDYAVGLHWDLVNQPLQADKEARGLARDPKFQADFYCVRHGGTQQFGLGFARMGHRANMPSLAAHLAAVNGDSWLGVFEVAGGYYVVGIQSDGVFSETDRFFEDAESAQSFFEEMRSSMEVGELFAPEDFGIRDARTVSIDVLLAGKVPIRLKSVGRSGFVVKAVVAVGLVTGLIVGTSLYLDSLEMARLQEEARLLAQRAAQSVGSQPEEIDIPSMPWEGKYQGAAVISACVESINEFQTSVPGWEVQEVICAGTNASARLVRTGVLEDGASSINWIYPYVKRPGFDPVVNQPATGSADMVTVDWILEEPPLIPVDLKTAPLLDVRKALLATFEGRMTRISLQNADSNDFWLGMSFSFSTDKDPMAFMDILSAIPGMIVTQVHQDIATSKWTIEGKAYEQLPLPGPRAR